MSRLSKIIDADASKRFEKNFNPDEIGLMLENFYFNEMRSNLFSEYLKEPKEETIIKCIKNFEKKVDALKNQSDNNNNENVIVKLLKFTSFLNALNEIKMLLEKETLLIPVK